MLSHKFHQRPDTRFVVQFTTAGNDLANASLADNGLSECVKLCLEQVPLGRHIRSPDSDIGCSGNFPTVLKPNGHIQERGCPRGARDDCNPASQGYQVLSFCGGVRVKPIVCRVFPLKRHGDCHGQREFALQPGLRLGYRAHLQRSEEHTSELQSLMRISYAVFCLNKKNTKDYLT